MDLIKLTKKELDTETPVTGQRPRPSASICTDRGDGFSRLLCLASDSRADEPGVDGGLRPSSLFPALFSTIYFYVKLECPELNSNTIKTIVHSSANRHLFRCDYQASSFLYWTRPHACRDSFLPRVYENSSHKKLKLSAPSGAYRSITLLSAAAPASASLPCHATVHLHYNLAKSFDEHQKTTPVHWDSASSHEI
ncbi:hypothetical protein GX51_04225 [Blastomyces parvus]|uniref:Uncharacterized protein n=1 Tax=Blastomyces parvus TaxID=2060905 RepID=A0A2B7X2V8_9EURO|nr:hypothetical protein GX51_04225 [Blastomyces parvus]